MRLPSLGPRRAAGPIRVPVPEVLNTGYGVYFHCAGAPPEDAELRADICAWLERHAEEPLGPALRHYTETRFFSLTVGERDMLPPPPLEVLRWFRPGELEERRFEEATHLVVVSAPDTLAAPRIGFWTALASARAITDARQGVILDPEIPRLLPIESHVKPVPNDGQVAVSEHILLPTSVDRSGRALITSKGMGKFGLPELELRDAPPHLQDSLAHALNGIAQHLVMVAEAHAAPGDAPARELLLDREIRLTLADLLRSQGSPPEPEPPPGTRGWAMVGLQYRPRRRGDSFLRIVPPAGFKGEPGVWLVQMLSDLVGSGTGDIALVPEGSEAMEAAHRRAVAELPGVKRRWQTGLREGEALLVKHGFAARDGSGSEFMWVSVTAWSGDRLRGHLFSEPRYRLDLRAGQTVEVREADVFDWLILRDGVVAEGGYTDRAAEAEGEEPEPPVG